ncbi:Unknown protein, partial [Striga hermonthica]
HIIQVHNQIFSAKTKLLRCNRCTFLGTSRLVAIQLREDTVLLLLSPTFWHSDIACCFLAPSVRECCTCGSFSRNQDRLLDSPRRPDRWTSGLTRGQTRGSLVQIAPRVVNETRLTSALDSFQPGKSPKSLCFSPNCL